MLAPEVRYETYICQYHRHGRTHNHPIIVTWINWKLTRVLECLVHSFFVVANSQNSYFGEAQTLGRTRFAVPLKTSIPPWRVATRPTPSLTWTSKLKTKQRRCRYRESPYDVLYLLVFSVTSPSATRSSGDLSLAVPTTATTRPDIVINVWQVKLLVQTFAFLFRLLHFFFSNS